MLRQQLEIAHRSARSVCDVLTVASRGGGGCGTLLASRRRRRRPLVRALGLGRARSDAAGRACVENTPTITTTTTTTSKTIAKHIAKQVPHPEGCECARARPQHSTKHTRASSINSVCVCMFALRGRRRVRVLRSYEPCTVKPVLRRVFLIIFRFFFVFRKVLMFTASLDGSYTIPTNVL